MFMLAGLESGPDSVYGHDPSTSLSDLVVAFFVLLVLASCLEHIT